MQLQGRWGDTIRSAGFDMILFLCFGQLYSTRVPGAGGHLLSTSTPPLGNRSFWSVIRVEKNPAQVLTPRGCAVENTAREDATQSFSSHFCD